LIETTKSHLETTQSLSLDFTNISVPNPIARPDRPKDAPPMPEEAADLEVFHYQRDSGIHAIGVVRDLHLASNAENAEFGMSLVTNKAKSRPLTSWDITTNDFMS
jgi:hypothetical protein